MDRGAPVLPDTASAPQEPGGGDVEARHVERALTYLARLHGSDPQRAAAAQAASARWRRRHPAHEAAWADAQRRWDAVQHFSPRLREALPPGQHALDGARRRSLGLLGGSGLLVILAGGFGGWFASRGPTFELQASTGRAEHRDGLVLPDGTRLDLAADSSLKASYRRDRREVRLGRGRVRFDVARDTARPFVVLTRLGRVEVLGTAFSVADRGQRVEVAVDHGTVQVRSGAAAAELRAGDRAALESEGRVARLPAQATGAAASWRAGWWSFIDAPLAESVAEVNAYLAEPLAVAPEVADLRITGSFPIDRPQLFVDSLPQVLPVRVAGSAPRLRIEARRP